MSDAQPQEQQFIIQRIYIKDVSFEAPNSPAIFTQEWNPNTNLDLNTKVNTLANDNYEVELFITITVKSDDKTAFLVEVKQAGVFFIQGYAQEQLNHLLAAYCPNILFPYAREVIAGMVSKGSFPELHLSPINFDALYARRLQEEQAKAGAA
ncbi:MAG: protein-export chaperone SecB [Candidatus Thiothrix sulfatifontis]|jgi:preprotein translocase subunit SecB|uniref:Protein-export protein SecB n=2 Tax=Thiothrix TaxID=1030 RepID=A0AA51MSA2_9GAMM|nr:protein-export chaperone SecB [Thiothrix subterranea]OQX15306.1 MAG: protein-export chaperone SecB [Thiothrix lacustris]UOG92510.1 MAG: protein-export chaperone SecB [Candidatus Thiothrix sulfatifontis]MDQ5768589.1 protein-export chaperone SecB [Thiothrix subterranea]QQZ29158.1 protein-export chaperone SecB [Thiothrix subterranea]WML87527.1 protein-export chaperone SecB [Thiothrix subterranea]